MVIRNELRWLNAVTGWIHPDDLDLIAALPFVDSLRPVATFVRSEPAAVEQSLSIPEVRQAATDVFNYGNSRQQLALIGVNHLHAAGFTGRGVRIGFMDTGFSLGIRAFDCLNLQGTRDFINGDTDVGDGLLGDMRHGTQTLSLCAGFDEGTLVGVALNSEYVLAKTEIADNEIRVEEDYWVAGLEWLDSMGCDIVSSSLGYLDWYTDEDFDGNTAPSTIAADLAAARGVLVVNAVGNYGCGNGDIRIIVPADGDSVLAVGASTLSGQWATFSSCGPTTDGRVKPDVIAPGQDVWTALPNTRKYEPGDGTSFATPLVSGVCALLLEQNPSLTPFGLIELLRATAHGPTKPVQTVGWGLVQAAEAAGLDPATIVPNRQFECVRTSAHVELWPNPATSATTIALVDGTLSDGTFRVFTVTGALVREGDLVDGRGKWNGSTESGALAAPGVYLIHVRTDNVNEVVKLAWLPQD
jgi:subtilisin family serine protease